MVGGRSYLNMMQDSWVLLYWIGEQSMLFGFLTLCVVVVGLVRPTSEPRARWFCFFDRRAGSRADAATAAVAGGRVSGLSGAC